MSSNVFGHDSFWVPPIGQSLKVWDFFPKLLDFALTFWISDCYAKCLPMCSGMAAFVFRSASPRLLLLLLLCLAPWRPCDVTPRATIAVQPTLPKLWPNLPFPSLLGGFFLLKGFREAKTTVSSEKKKGRKCEWRRSGEVQHSLSKINLKIALLKLLCDFADACLGIILLWS